MSAKIYNPFTSEEIRSLYESGFSTAIIEEYVKLTGVSISKNVAIKWVREAAVKTVSHSPYSNMALIPCPFSAERLNDLYWREQKSLSEIGELAYVAGQLPAQPSRGTVTRWMKNAGIKLRTAAQSQSVRVRNHPDDFQGYIVHALIKLTPEIRRKNSRITPEVQAMGRKAAAARKRTIRETRACSNPECRKPITRRPCEFRCAPDRTFCSISCANKMRNNRQPESE